MYAYLCFAGGEISNMVKNEDSGSPRWSASLFMQTTEDVARAVAAAAAAATTVRSPRPYVVFSSKDDNGNSPLHKLQHQVSRVLKGFSQPPEVKSGTYNLQPKASMGKRPIVVPGFIATLDHRPLKEPSRLFESMVVVGLHPNCDIQALQKQYFERKSEGSGKFRSALSGQHQSRAEPNLEPQVLFVYPPEKQLPLKYKDLLSFCFPGGVEVHAIEKTSSMSELNEILLGQGSLGTIASEDSDIPRCLNPRERLAQAQVLRSLVQPNERTQPFHVDEFNLTAVKIANLEKQFKKAQGLNSIPDIEDGHTEAAIRLPDRFKMPYMDRFDGSGDPMVHI
ncbi:hypothetical protein HYC85_010352 [Camellia sinensis]|uniref:Uncharacterized protein n=1 Tax=Camellia sinensis TaxID=4442 RepID=A0A7J7HKA4_CAMSI|nr:hypothetical protein HYC85_010352 [Camellia sinensis]